MELLTIDQLRTHCKADGDDDEVLIIYGNGAESACAQLANRYLFADADTLAAAKTAAVAAYQAGWTAYDAAVIAAESASDVRVKDVLIENARWELQRLQNEMEKTVNGLVASDEVNQDILDAVLLIAGHWYENRSEVVIGQGAAAVALPMAAQNIMALKRYQGRLT